MHSNLTISFLIALILYLKFLSRILEILTPVSIAGASAIFNVGDYSVTGDANVSVTGLSARFDQATGLVWYSVPQNDTLEAWTTVTTPL